MHALEQKFIKSNVYFVGLFKIFPFSNLLIHRGKVYLQTHRQVTTTNNYSKHNCCSVSELEIGRLSKAFLLLLLFLVTSANKRKRTNERLLSGQKIAQPKPTQKRI